MASHFRPKPGQGLRWIVKRRHQDLNHIDFGLVELAPGEVLRDGTKDEEAVVYLFGGTVTVSGEGFDFGTVGERADVFGGKASAVYLPPHSRYVIEAKTAVRAAICRTPATAGGPVRVIRPKDVKVREVGKDNWYREVHDVGVDNIEARGLIFGETFNPPGNWSSAPPHKHDVENPPEEAKLEELYHYRLDPPGGFGLQRVYTADGYDQVFVVEDGDVVTLPRGYHPVVAAPGYRLYYFWVLAGGRDRRLLSRDDPKHSWIRTAR